MQVEGDEKVDLVKFIFNMDNTIDVDALESYVIHNQQSLLNMDDGFHIDLGQMMVSQELMQIKKELKHAQNEIISHGQPQPDNQQISVDVSA